MALLILLPLAVPALLAGLALVPSLAGLRRWGPVASSAAVCLTGVAVLLAGGPLALWGVLRADALSGWLLAAIGAIGLVATWGGVTRDDPRDARGSARYAALLCLFLAAMSLAVVADSLGIMWVAVEATTIATAFLVGHHGTRRAIEAAWKYVVIGSVGVTVAFLGIVLLYASSGEAETLSWTVLATGAGLDPALVTFGSALAVLGFATKAGLAPMHSWLPDAHSQAPAPVSGLMSGVLLSVALYAIIRIQAIADAVVGPDLIRWLLVALGLLSLALAAALLIRQRDYKRMLAYSSIEHMGVMALGVAAGAIPAVLLYVLAHGLIKASLFVLSGRLLAEEDTTRVDDVRGLLARRPRIAVPWIAAMVGLLGFPPFGIFFAEVGILVAGWRAGLGVPMAIAVVLLAVVFGALLRTGVRMLFGPPVAERATRDEAPFDSPAARSGSATTHTRPIPIEPATAPLAPIVLALVTAAVVPFLAAPVGTALDLAAAALGVG